MSHTTGGVRRTLTTDDDVELAVYEQGEHGAPVVVLVHGYPDDHTVWDGVAAVLAERFRVVRYDVRGCGASSVPADTASYALPRLAADLGAVLDAVSPHAPAHLVAHDWGSIQSWEAVTDPAFADRLSSYTSISGPSLDMAAMWLRGGVRHPRAALTQLAHSYYIGLFQLPALPELAARRGLVGTLVTRSARAGTPWARHRPRMTPATKDAVNGIELYRANVVARMARPQPRRTTVPVQVLAPTHDPHVTMPLQTQAPIPYVDRLHTRSIIGNHWVVAQRPAMVAAKITEFIDHTSGGPLPRSLRPAAARPGGHLGGRLALVTGAGGHLGGRLALVTGAGSGIGRATCLELARRGADVIVTDIDETSAKETVELVLRTGREAWSYGLDVADADAWDRLAEQVVAAHGVPDVVVNNAGIGMGGAFLDTSVDDWRRIIDINLYGVIHGSRVLGRLLVDRGEGGHIANVASAAAFAPSRIMSAYGTTKAAVLSLTESLRAELSYAGIGVTAVCPGFVDTNISRTTRFVGTDPEEQERLSAGQQASYRRRNYTPERLARHLVDAIVADTPVAAISAEAKLFQLGHRYVPTLTRRLARLDLNEI